MIDRGAEIFFLSNCSTVSISSRVFHSLSDAKIYVCTLPFTFDGACKKAKINVESHVCLNRLAWYRYAFDDYRLVRLWKRQRLNQFCFLLPVIKLFLCYICEFSKQNFNNFFLDFFVLANSWLPKRENHSVTFQQCDGYSASVGT